MTIAVNSHYPLISTAIYMSGGPFLVLSSLALASFMSPLCELECRRLKAPDDIVGASAGDSILRAIGFARVMVRRWFMRNFGEGTDSVWDFLDGGGFGVASVSLLSSESEDEELDSCSFEGSDEELRQARRNSSIRISGHLRLELRLSTPLIKQCQGRETQSGSGRYSKATIFSTISALESPSNGSVPVSRAYIMQPMLHMSREG